MARESNLVTKGNIMKKTKIILTLIVATAVVGGNFAARADAPQPTPLQEKGDKGDPFNGKVEAVDAKAKTLTVGGAVILVTDATKLTKLGKTITLADIKVGNHVIGKSSKNADGKAEAILIMVSGESN
jgi:hypothetical protein